MPANLAQRLGFADDDRIAVIHCDDIEDNKTGILVPPEDPQALAEAVIGLLNVSTLRTKMGKACRR